MANFDIKTKDIAEQNVLTDYFSRNPTSNSKLIKNYDEEFVINSMIPFIEFINHLKVRQCRWSKEIEERTEQNEQCEQITNQSEASKMNEPI